MEPVYLIGALVAIVYIIFDISRFEKDPANYKAKKKHYRSFKSPVASHEELFDALGIKDDPKYRKMMEEEQAETNQSE